VQFLYELLDFVGHGHPVKWQLSNMATVKIHGIACAMSVMGSGSNIIL
jgi:hypothetical protein